MIGKRSTRIEALKRLEETPEKHNEQNSITQPSKSANKESTPKHVKTETTLK